MNKRTRLSLGRRLIMMLLTLFCLGGLAACDNDSSSGSASAAGNGSGGGAGAGGGSGAGGGTPPVDTDGDGTADATDTDDDNDGVADVDDAFPLDASESADTDGDGIGNVADPDDDGDTVADADDLFPLDPNESADFDADGIGNNADPDDDNDGVPDVSDFAPENPARTKAIEPLFPKTNGVTDFPDTDVGNQLEWIMAQLRATATPLTEIEDRFASGNAADWQAFFETLRTAYPDAEVIEPINVTARNASIVIGDPATPTATGGLLTVATRGEDGRITTFGGQNFPQNPSSVLVADQSLSLAEAADRVASTADAASVLVARIDDSNQCVATFDRAAGTVRPTGSIFKVWVLGALAQAVEDGVVQPEETIALDANEVVPVGEALSSDPLGTNYRVRDLASMMLGTSDNTATDLLHERVGRDRLEAALGPLGNQNLSGLTPFLSVNETFHLYWTVSPTDAAAWPGLTDAEQRTYLMNTLAPLGPVTAFPNANAQVLVDGTWEASPLDLCRAMAALRQYRDDTPAFALIDEAYGANAGVWGARRSWERVWFKGGSLADGQGLLVLTYGWMLETDGRGTFVVVGMGETQASSPGRIDQNAFLSAMARIVEIVDESN